MSSLADYIVPLNLVHFDTDLVGVDVYGRTSIVVTSSSLEQEWEEYGLKLYIGSNTLPQGTDSCKIWIKVSLSGNYEFPDNNHLISAIFWFCCEPPCKFTKPVTIEIQHCAKSENISKLRFVKAVCTQKQLPYTFKQIEGHFGSHSSYGIVNLNKFSGVGITQEGTKDREYCAGLYYNEQEFQRTCIDFVVTFNLKTCLTVS